MELYNITSFVSKNRDSIDNVTKKVKDVINALNIDFSGELSVGKIIKINGEINKAIKTNKQLIESLSKIPDNDKVGIITGVIIDIINSEEFKQILSNEQRKQIEDFCNDTETAETIVGLIDWISDETLESMDLNKDGMVTESEIEDNYVGCCLCVDRCGQDDNGCGCYQPDGCCKCCPGCVSKTASCFSGFFLKFLCCKKNKKPIKYKDVNNNLPTDEIKTSNVEISIN